jgi:hypothetical protein
MARQETQLIGFKSSTKFWTSVLQMIDDGTGQQSILQVATNVQKMNVGLPEFSLVHREISAQDGKILNNS